MLFSTLKNSILTSFPKQTEGIITIGAEYAAYLEKGTSRMRPRPFVRPALDGALDSFSKGGIVGGVI